MCACDAGGRHSGSFVMRLDVTRRRELMSPRCRTESLRSLSGLQDKRLAMESNVIHFALRSLVTGDDEWRLSLCSPKSLAAGCSLCSRKSLGATNGCARYSVLSPPLRGLLSLAKGCCVTRGWQSIRSRCTHGRESMALLCCSKSLASAGSSPCCSLGAAN